MMYQWLIRLPSNFKAEQQDEQQQSMDVELDTSVAGKSAPPPQEVVGNPGLKK